MLVERKGNGDFTITRELGEELSVEEQNLAIAILWHVPDMELLGEQGCVGNFDMCHFFYNAYTDKKYMLLYDQDGKAFLNGETILLEAQDLDKDDRAEWKKEESA